MKPHILTAVLGSALSLCACAGADGFVGTWERSFGEGFSSLSFTPVNGGYRVRWSKVDGRATVHCDDQGHCEEYQGNDKVCDWWFDAHPGEADGELLLEVRGDPVDDALPEVRYVDRLVIEPGGKTLSAHPVPHGEDPEGAGRPVLRFRKVSDRPL